MNRLNLELLLQWILTQFRPIVPLYIPNSHQKIIVIKGNTGLKQFKHEVGMLRLMFALNKHFLKVK